MQKSIRFIVIFFTLLTAGFWASLQFDSVQTWAKSKAATYLRKETGCEVTVESFRGAPPFLLAADSITLSHPDVGTVHIDSIDIIPSWLEIIFGRISFIWITSSGIDLTALNVKSTPKKITSYNELLPNLSFSIHSFHISDIKAPKEYYEPLLNTYSDQSEINCLYSVNGSVFWKPGKEKLLAELLVTPYAGEVSPLSVDLQLSATSETTSLITTLDALKAGDGSVFFSLPCDRLGAKATFEANSSDVIDSLFSIQDSKTIPSLKGSWEIHGSHRDKSQPGLQPIIQFRALGNLEAANNSTFSFASEEITCQKIEPIRSYKATKKQRLSQEFELADVENPKDASKLSKITIIPTPQSIQGSITFLDSTITCNLAASSLTVADYTIAKCSVTATGKNQNNDWQGTVQADLLATSKAKEVPFSLSANYSSDTPFYWKISEIAATVAGHTIAGNLQATLFPTALSGKLESTNNDARQLAQIFDASLEKAHVLVTFAPDYKDKENSIASQQMDLQASLADFSNTTMSCKKAQLALSATNLFSTAQVKTVLSANEFENESITLHTLLLETSSKDDQSQPSNSYSVHIDGQTGFGPCNLDSTGYFGVDKFTLNTLQATSGGHKIKNNGPLVVTKDKDGLHVSPFEFVSETTMRLEGSAELLDERHFATLTYSNVPLEAFEPFLGDLALFGNISGRLGLSGTKQDPQLIMTCASSALCLWNPNKIQAAPLSASCEVRVEHSMLHVSSEIEGLSATTPTVLELTAPLTFDKSTISFSDSEKLTGHLQLEFDSNTLLSSYLDENELMEGIVSLKAEVSGVASKPEITGDVTWTKGKFFIPALGTLFSSIDMKGHLKDNTLIIDHISATDGLSGKFTATGWAKELLSKNINYKLEGEPTNFVTVSRDDSSVVTSGSLTLNGTLKEVTLTGDFEVKEALYILSPTLSKNVPTIDLTYVGEKAQTTNIEKKPFIFALDLNLNMPKGMVRGMGLESQWKGTVRVKGKNSDIDLDGKINLQAGTLKFAEKTFTLTQGSLEFQGDLQKKSMIQVIATNDVGDISTQIILQGPLESPRIVIQSNPAMSEKEILSWILFNKSSSDISPMQGIQLGQMLLKFKGSGNDVDVISEIKQKLRIDRLDFGSGQSSKPQMSAPGPTSDAATGVPEALDSGPSALSVQVGKYISDGVIVTLSKDVTNEVNRFGVEANVTDHITAQANVGDDAETELSLEWKLRY